MPDQPRAGAPISRELLASTPGVEVFRRMIAGELPTPPFSYTTDIFVVEAEEGRVVFEGTPTEAFTNPLAAFTAAGSRRCSIPRWAARCTPASSPGRPTPPWR